VTRDRPRGAGGHIEGEPMFERDIFGEEHHQFRETVRRFFRKEVEPYVGQWETEGMFPRDIFRKAGAAGLLQVGLPAEYGGGGGTFHQGDLPGGSTVTRPPGPPSRAFCDRSFSYDLACRKRRAETLLDTALRQRRGRRRGGDHRAAAGSDVANVRTTAIRHGDHYVLNGTKIWLTNLSHCDMLIVVARTDPATKSAGGLSAAGRRRFAGYHVQPADRDRRARPAQRRPGVLRERPIPRPPARRSRGRGLAQIMLVVNDARLTNAARWLASCETAYGLTLDFVRNRQAFGQRVLDFQNTQFRMADMKTEIAVGRAFLDKYLLKGLAGTITFDETAMVKLWISELKGA
jgi:alkylation response protein AidB-like acyl-CoA dehydrogenase